MNLKINSNKYIKKHPVLTRIARSIKYYFLLFVRKEDSPQSIAHGLSIGIFVGWFPIIPLQALIAITFCTIFKANKIAGIIGTNIFTSAITAVPVFYAQHFLGRIFILHDFSYTKFKELFSHISIDRFDEIGKEILILFEMVTIGGLIVGIIFYPISYYLTYNAIVKRRQKLLSKKTGKIKQNK